MEALQNKTKAQKIGQIGLIVKIKDGYWGIAELIVRLKDETFNRIGENARQYVLQQGKFDNNSVVEDYRKIYCRLLQERGECPQSRLIVIT